MFINLIIFFVNLQEIAGFGNGDRYVIDLPEEYYNPGINQMINSGVIIKLAERGQGIDNDLTFLPAGEQIF